MFPSFRFLKNPQNEEFIELEISTTKLRMEKTDPIRERKININFNENILFFSLF